MNRENTEQSDIRENPATCAFAPIDTLRPFLEAVCHSKRDVPGFVGIEVRVNEWRATIPVSELYGLLDRVQYLDRRS
jgi:hypothetical protein